MHLFRSWWLQLLAVAALPAATALASYQAALLFPGLISVLGWKSVVSWFFLACAVAVVVLAWRAHAPGWRRAALGIALVVPLTVAWLTVGSRSTCYDGPSHIGGKRNAGVVSCR